MQFERSYMFCKSSIEEDGLDIQGWGCLYIGCDSRVEALRYNKADLHNPPFAVLAAAGKTLLSRPINSASFSLSKGCVV